MEECILVLVNSISDDKCVTDEDTGSQSGIIPVKVINN